jgi:SAM-dependent methyltransferase
MKFSVNGLTTVDKLNKRSIHSLNSIETKILQLLYYQKQLNLSSWPPITPKTIAPYEKWLLRKYVGLFRNLSSEDLKFCIQNLEALGLLEEGTPRGFFRPTELGICFGYNLIEYVKQVELNELNRIVDFGSLFEQQHKELKVLDVGCGGGASLIAIKAHGFVGGSPILIGLDIRFHELAAGRTILASFCPDHFSERLPPISFVQADGMRLPFADESFDLIYSKGVLCYMNRNSFIREARRVLVNRGRLVVITPSYRFFLKDGLNSLRRFRILSAAKQFSSLVNGLSLRLLKKQWRVRGTFFYGETSYSLSSELYAAGYNVIRCEYYKSRFSTNPIVAVAQKTC